MSKISFSNKEVTYRLVGDSHMVRFANSMVRQSDIGPKLMTKVFGNYAVSGIKIENLIGIISRKPPLISRLVVCIGTNDLLRLAEEGLLNEETWKERVQEPLMKLKKLFATSQEVVWLTVPPCPRIEYSEQALPFLRILGLTNKLIKSFRRSEKPKIKVIQTEHFLRCATGLPRDSYFEKFMGFGKKKRPDGIHLNSRGFKRLKKHLIKKGV